jgi:ATP-dependent RNA helicase DDX24/MAK5
MLENALLTPSQEDTFLRAAAEELGVDYTSSENESSKGKRGRGTNRKKKESEMRGLGKKEIGAMKAELKGMLTKRVNVGVSERYLTSGGVDVNALLAQKGTNGNGTEFLGGVQDLGL